MGLTPIHGEAEPFQLPDSQYVNSNYAMILPGRFMQFIPATQEFRLLKKAAQQKFFLMKRQLVYAAAAAIALGAILVICAELLEKMQARSQRREALEVRDRMIIPPRCVAKSKDMGLTQVQSWKDYFTRDEPFVPTP